MKEVVIIDGIRSPIGKYGGGLSKVRPDDLLANVLRALMERNGVDPKLIYDVFAGCGNQSGEDNRNVARMSLLLAGFPKEIPGVTVNRNCASALEAVNQAAKSIIANEGDVFIGAGVESMSRAPWSMPKPEYTPCLGHPKIWDTTVGWRYNNPRMDELYPIISLGQTAENIADEMKITRAKQDNFAVESHRRTINAINAGWFKSEIVPIHIKDSNCDLIVDTDEHPRYKKINEKYILNTSIDEMRKLKPAFRNDGTVTAGNSSGINDGAAAILMMTREKTRELGLKPMVRWLGSATAGVDPSVMGYGPVPATRKILKRLKLSIDDIGLIELNEAFAAQAIGCIEQLGLNPEITNVNGGAIALGHPTGCSGARILTTLIHEMKRRASNAPRPFYGLATLCVGVGQGVSTIVEWIDH
jgi:acetyl-CoA acetyltransferase family protein